MFVHLLAVLVLNQAAPAPPVDPETVDHLSDVYVTSRPEEVLCVRGEQRRGSRIARPSDCRMRAEWQAIKIERAERISMIDHPRYRRYALMDTFLTEQATARAAAHQVRRDLARAED